METKDESQNAPERFVCPDGDPERPNSRLPAGAVLAIILHVCGIVAFQFADLSFWYVVGGAVLVVASFVLGWRYRAALFRAPDDNDPRKLYHRQSS